MNNFERWLNGIPLPSIESYEELKIEVLQHTKRDFLFFPFLIGYVERFSRDQKQIRYLVSQLLFDLMYEENVNVILVTKRTEMTCLWKSIDDIKYIIKEVNKRWDAIGDREPEMNEVVWLLYDQWENT